MWPTVPQKAAGRDAHIRLNRQYFRLFDQLFSCFLFVGFFSVVRFSAFASHIVSEIHREERKHYHPRNGKEYGGELARYGCGRNAAADGTHVHSGPPQRRPEIVDFGIDGLLAVVEDEGTEITQGQRYHHITYKEARNGVSRDISHHQPQGQSTARQRYEPHKIEGLPVQYDIEGLDDVEIGNG